MSQQREVLERDLLLHGYFREIEKILDEELPKDIVYLIKMYHLKWMIFGIGSNECGMKIIKSVKTNKQTNKFVIVTIYIQVNLVLVEIKSIINLKSLQN